MKTSTTLPGDGITISTFGTDEKFVALKFRKIGELIELTSELSICLGFSYDTEEVSRKTTTDGDEAILIADDMQHAARKRLNELDAGDALETTNEGFGHGFGEAVDRVLTAPFLLRHLEAAVAAE